MISLCCLLIFDKGLLWRGSHPLHCHAPEHSAYGLPLHTHWAHEQLCGNTVTCGTGRSASEPALLSIWCELERRTDAVTLSLCSAVCARLWVTVHAHGPQRLPCFDLVADEFCGVADRVHMLPVIIALPDAIPNH